VADPPSASPISLTGGKLVADPTDLGVAFPYGGTVLGVMHEVAILRRGFLDGRTAEELGGEVAEQTYRGEEWAVSAVLQTWDADALARIYTIATGGSGGVPVVSYPGATRGSKQSDRAIALLLAPEDAAETGALFYAALPQLLDDVLILSGRERLEKRAGWLGIRDSSGRVVQMARVQDMTL